VRNARKMSRNVVAGMIGTGLVLLGLVAGPVEARSIRAKQELERTGIDPDARGKVAVKIKSRRGELEGELEIKVQRLDGGATFEVVLDGVRIGNLTTTPRGTGKARFRTRQRRDDQLLGADPRGLPLAVRNDAGDAVLDADLVATALDGSDVRCCIPDDSGPECEDRTVEECALAGGVDLGPGSCLPNPCDDGTPPAPGDDIVCCLPDDSGPECEDRTPAQCSAQGGINLGPGTCVPNPCTATTPSVPGTVQCCLPDDSGTECEDRTDTECTAQGGVTVGTGLCVPGACDGVVPPGGGANATVRVECERRSDRSKVSVDGNGLVAATYQARVVSGGNEATAPARGTIGDEVEFDFDSDGGDIAAGATPIAAGFIQGTPPTVTGSLLGADGSVVAEATVTCRVK